MQDINHYYPKKVFLVWSSVFLTQNRFLEPYIKVSLKLFSVFSPAYLRDIGPISLHHSFYLDVGLGWRQWF